MSEPRTPLPIARHHLVALFVVFALLLSGTMLLEDLYTHPGEPRVLGLQWGE